jgi:hypothetical protein
MDTYSWKLTKSEIDFYGGEWKNYEDTNDYSDEKMERIKDLFVKGNTVAFHEIVKLRDDGITLTVTFPHNEEYSVYFKNGTLQVDSNNGDEISFGTPKTIEEIREVVEYVTTSCDYLPINCISSIKKGTEIVY